MTDIVERMKATACPDNTGCMSIRMCVCDVVGDAVDEIERLNKALKWEQDRSGRVGTHSPGCWTWGHQHYQCAIQHIAALDKELESAALIVGTVREDLKDNEGMLDEAVKEVDELKEEVRRLRVEAGYD